jgi:hypothetical protein
MSIFFYAYVYVDTVAISDRIHFRLRPDKLRLMRSFARFVSVFMHCIKRKLFTISRCGCQTYMVIKRYIQLQQLLYSVARDGPGLSIIIYILCSNSILSNKSPILNSLLRSDDFYARKKTFGLGYQQNSLDCNQRRLGE